MNKYVTVVFHVPQKYGSQSGFHILFHILSRVWKAPVMILYAWKKRLRFLFGMQEPFEHSIFTMQRCLKLNKTRNKLPPASKHNT